VSQLTEELRLLEAFDGAFATTTSLGRNSGLAYEQVVEELERLQELGLVAQTEVAALPGVAVQAYLLTLDGAAALGGGVRPVAPPGPSSRPSALAERLLEAA